MIKSTITVCRCLQTRTRLLHLTAIVAAVVFSMMSAGAFPASNNQDAAVLDDIRAKIVAAHEQNGSGPYEALVSFLAERVETVHEPRFPNDGMVDREPLARFLEIEHRLHDVAIRNRRMDVSFSVVGDGIVMKGVMTGELPDGRALVHPVHVVYRVTNGKIDRFWIDASTPEIMEGYRLQREAFMSPEAQPLLDEMRAAMPRE